MSNYGPKGMKLYDDVVNTDRKASRTGEHMDWDTNSGVRSWNGSTEAGKSQVAREAARLKRLNKAQPVKIYSDEEIAELNRLYKKV